MPRLLDLVLRAAAIGAAAVFLSMAATPTYAQPAPRAASAPAGSMQQAN